MEYEAPPNQIDKPGYRLEYSDEFNSASLDESKWGLFHLPQWSSQDQSRPKFFVKDSNLTLQIEENQKPWCPEFDGMVLCSSIQTGVFSGAVGTNEGQHRFSSALVVREAQTPTRMYTPQYGYFEMRARGMRAFKNHVALWMIGFEENPEQSGEIAICEIMGEYATQESTRLGHGVKAWFDSNLKDEFHEDFLKFDVTKYHIYSAEWKPDSIDFFLDNQKIRTIYQSPKYPMQFMLGIYERPLSAPANRDDSYPKQFVIDYFRGYQPIGGYHRVP